MPAARLKLAEKLVPVMVSVLLDSVNCTGDEAAAALGKVDADLLLGDCCARGRARSVGGIGTSKGNCCQAISCPAWAQRESVLVTKLSRNQYSAPGVGEAMGATGIVGVLVAPAARSTGGRVPDCMTSPELLVTVQRAS